MQQISIKTGWRIVSYSKSSSEDVWFFLLFFSSLGQDREESTSYELKGFQPQ